MDAKINLLWLLVSLGAVTNASYQTYDNRALRSYNSYKPSYGYSGYGDSYSSNYGRPHGSNSYRSGYRYRSQEPSYAPKKLASSYGPSISRSGHTSITYEPKHTYKPLFVYKPPKTDYRSAPKSHYEPKASYAPSYKSTSYGYDSKPSYSYGGHTNAGYGKRPSYNPCEGRKEGDYVLDGDFRRYFHDVNPECNFVKCAHYKAYVNPCSYGTKNDKYGNGFCSYLDSHHECGYPPPKKRDY